MGFRSLGACSLGIIFSDGPRGPLKTDECLALWALDGHQVTDYLSGDAPTGAGTGGKDAVRLLLQDDLTMDPSPAVARMVIGHQGKWWPCYLGKLLSIMGAAAFVHGARPQSVERKTFHQRTTPKGLKKFRTKSGFLADFLRTKSGLMIGYENLLTLSKL